ncbi:uncharacterized protein L3040_001194 [Drepanopeziza brunnea f. sp. 'multigermtubi']|uniref:Alpha-acetolactate decarboxylase n=1 Tax=Marssonina brunnea f. sp. multigermtubi (strain MB_m1) TaxID=1072389 RepID=K1X8A9_MARBU|nr:alpha-acetolactate decarboxylase [Drepanopeziza brunnea f. sp. 'multigermtubi' MB_m1]EKD16913.1 alpha-acetolactate decarboxylase [Drepanopeziza brunnea f. sp. 'multigermtubi' MB_m1]KAJ5054932.1 hypothetical protein L3040_001194 [Drepanopeziza brunnea f. sp. 'multigermtubi']
MAPNEVYQFSIISALMSGLASASSSMPVSTLLTHGNFGLGTFEQMDGEMIVLDSEAYQFHADGSTHLASGAQLVPFAMVADFQPALARPIAVASKGSLLAELEQAFPSARNAFVLFRLVGRFGRVKVRAIHKQAYEGQPLAELAEGQAVREFVRVEGTVVGIRSPGWSEGVSVVGVHAHFIDVGRRFGGHILELEGDGEVGFEGVVAERFHVEVPGSTEFGERELDLDRAAIQKAEG